MMAALPTDAQIDHAIEGAFLALAREGKAEAVMTSDMPTVTRTVFMAGYKYALVDVLGEAIDNFLGPETNG